MCERLKALEESCPCSRVVGKD